MLSLSRARALTRSLVSASRPAEERRGARLQPAVGPQHRSSGCVAGLCGSVPCGVWAKWASLRSRAGLCALAGKHGVMEHGWLDGVVRRPDDVWRRVATSS